MIQLSSDKIYTFKITLSWFSACLLFFTFENQSTNTAPDKPYQSQQYKSEDVLTEAGSRTGWRHNVLIPRMRNQETWTIVARIKKQYRQDIYIT